MRFILACALWSCSTSAYAHACLISQVTLAKDEVVADLHVIDADLEEVESIYTVVLYDPAVVDIAPLASVQHEGIFTFTGVGPGDAVVAIDWFYEPTGAGNTCFFSVTVLDPQSTGNTPGAGSDGEPINTFSGELYNTERPDLNLGGPMPLFFQRYFGSYLRRGFVLGDLGNNWLHNFDLRLAWNGTQATFFDERGKVVSFNNAGGPWTQLNALDVPYQLTTGPGSVELYDPRADRFYTFDYSTGGPVTGKLATVADGKGNVHTLSYDFNGRLQSVTDGVGRTLTFTYNADFIPKIALVSDGSRSVQFLYQDVVDDESLTHFIDARGNSTVYAYKDTSGTADRALMSSMQRPKTNTPLSQTFFGVAEPTQSGRVETQSDALGNMTSFSYDTGTGVTDITHADGGIRVHTHNANGELTVLTDEVGNSITMDYDGSGRRDEVVDRKGGITSLTYHAPSGKIATVTAADNTTTSFTYTPRVNNGATIYDLTEITYPDATTAMFGYDASGNVISFTDQIGNVWALTYNGMGLPLTATNPEGGVSTYTYNADGTLASAEDSSNNVTGFGYDSLFRLIRIDRPDTSSIDYTYDNNDRLLTITDERNNTLTFTYDVNNNLVTATDRLGQVTAYEYDTQDRVTKVIDPLLGERIVNYDAVGQISSTTDRNGNVTSFGYDILGLRTSVTDGESKTSGFAYDPETILASTTDPLSNTTAYATDPLHRLTAITSPLGNIGVLLRDTLGRVTEVQNANNEITTIDRDGRGLIEATVLPESIQASYVRNALGQITTVTDPLGNAWERDFDIQGRGVARRDPLGNEITYAYDNRNRLSTAISSVGTADFTYDAAGNMTLADFSDGTSLGMSHDAENRLTSAAGLSLSYDANGRIINSNGIAMTRDAEGRIATVTLAPGNTVTYGYDGRNLLTSVADWVSGNTLFSYDDAGRLITITRPNGVTTTYTYDDDSRLIGIDEGALSSTTLTRDAIGQIIAANRNVPLVAPAAATATQSLDFDAASQVATYSYDGLGRLTSDAARNYTWDDASRLTEFTDNSNTVNFSYDGLRQRLSRTESGASRNYVWNYALGLQSIQVEADDSSDLRYYVYTPSGHLLYSIEASDNSRRYYHFDETGNTLFVTDDAGLILSSYAYSPFGEVLAETGTIENRFKWQGQFGVQSEGDLHYMRARYYDSKSGRFLSRDPLTNNRAKEINPYQYAINNPLRFGDPLGLEKISIRALEFLRVAVQSKADFDQIVDGLTFVGDLGGLELPGGAIGTAVGFERIENEFNYRPSQDLASVLIARRPIQGLENELMLSAGAPPPISAGTYAGCGEVALNIPFDLSVNYAADFDFGLFSEGSSLSVSLRSTFLDVADIVPVAELPPLISPCNIGDSSGGMTEIDLNVSDRQCIYDATGPLESVGPNHKSRLGFDIYPPPGDFQLRSTFTRNIAGNGPCDTR